MRDDEIARALDDYARSREPRGADVARVLREVRRARQRTPLSTSLFAYGGWVVAVVALVLVVARGRTAPVVIASDPSVRVVATQAATTEVARELTLDEPPAPVAPAVSTTRLESRPVVRPVTRGRAPVKPAVTTAAPAASVAPAREPEAVPRLSFEQTRLLGQGHLFRIESIIEVVRDVGIGSSSPAESRCLAEQHHRLIVILEAARAEMAALERAVEAGNLPTVDLSLERVVAQRQAADAIYRDVRLCLGAL